MLRTKKRTLTEAEKETYLRDALGLKKVVRNGRAHWVRDKTQSGSRLQYGAAIRR